MVSFDALPAEMRQRILSFLLPDTQFGHEKLPPDVYSVLRTSRTMCLDIAAALRIWSPMHCILHPSDIPDYSRRKAVIIGGHRYAPRIENLQLNLFHDTDVRRMQQKQPWWRPGLFVHRELIDAWATYVYYLPESVVNLFLDVTPAPACRRSPYRIALTKFLKGYRSQIFLGAQDEHVAYLARLYDNRYKGLARIRLAGSLYRRSNSFLERVRESAGLPLEFVGDWIGAEVERVPEISRASQMVARSCAMPQLSTVAWSQPAVWTFVELTRKGYEKEAVEDLKIVAKFWAQGTGNTLRMDVVRKSRRPFQHRIGEDLGFLTCEEGDHVVLRRR